MSYTDLQSLSVGEFKRLCGVSRETFGEMVEVLRPQLERQGKRGGQNKLSVEEQLLVALEYWREYRSQFHIAIPLGTTRNYSRSHHSKSRKHFSQMRQVPPAEPASIVSTRLGVEGVCRGCERNGN